MQRHNNTKIKPSQTIRRSDGRVIGEVIEGTFQKHILGSKHLLREPRAVGFDLSALRDAESAGADRILVIDDETNAQYLTSFRHFWRKSFVVNRGFGEQRAMRLSEFNKPDNGDDDELTTSKTLQLGLFSLASLVR